ncbi:unnamed protein product [marine sediment metagenome]|uniref:PIN domain-containing protein n=1 Tax=marine sediment metagenome TaxID=412755 RepID=X1GRV2_9ZZZZ
MNNVVVDTNPLVYIYNSVSDLGEKYATLLWELARKNILNIPKLVYGELSLIFRHCRELNAFLSDTGITIGEIKTETYITAAKRWDVYNNRRRLICQSCGTKLGKLKCKKCKYEIKIRQHILTDFLIGAYALEIDGRKIVTSDIGYYSSYFPELNIITVD